jgi:NADPH:quinone reductase-like Zn-dependent oxidoreductase
VVATTSSDAKAERLRSLGASKVINYRECKEWGEAARAVTPDQVGFDHVIDVGGNATLPQSLQAVRTDGIVSLVGMIGGAGEQGDAPLLSALWHSCIARGFFLGSRNMFRDFVQFCEAKDLKPALDDVVFSLVDAKEALERLSQQKHFSKVVIKIP